MITSRATGILRTTGIPLRSELGIRTPSVGRPRGVGLTASAPLVYQERPAAGDPRGLLVLHHGRGTDELDLLPLADAFDPERRLHVGERPRAAQLPGSPGFHWYVVPQVGYPDPRDVPTPPTERSREVHDELWERTGARARADRARRLLDGDGDELRARPRLGPARPRRDPRVQRLHPDRRGLGAVVRRPNRHPGADRARPERPSDRRRLRPRGPRAARPRRVRRRLPRVRRDALDRPGGRPSRSRLARRARSNKLGRWRSPPSSSCPASTTPTRG